MKQYKTIQKYVKRVKCRLLRIWDLHFMNEYNDYNIISVGRKITSGLRTSSSKQLNNSRMNFSLFDSMKPKLNIPLNLTIGNSNNTLMPNKQILNTQTRTVTKFSLKRGTRKTVKIVTHKFFRLYWGIWIRTIAGRHNKLWKKSGVQKKRLLQHVFCNMTQSKMLDKMVTSYWKKPRYYIEDPYEIYHSRENFPYTRKKPWRPKEC